MRMQLTCIYLLFILSTASPPEAQPGHTFQDEICSDLAHLQRELDRLTDSITIRYKGDTLFLATFSAAQKAWKRYVDAQIAMKFPAIHKHREYGKLYPMCLCLERVHFMEARIKELSAWREGNGTEEGCPGSLLVE